MSFYLFGKGRLLAAREPQSRLAPCGAGVKRFSEKNKIFSVRPFFAGSSERLVPSPALELRRHSPAEPTAIFKKFFYPLAKIGDFWYNMIVERAFPGRQARGEHGAVSTSTAFAERR